VSKIRNYLGQLRLYSLADFMLMLVAAGASPNSPRFWGAVVLWIGFLALLESEHHDEGRELVSNKLAWLLLLLGFAWWGRSVTGYMFVVCSVCYALKKNKPWGLLSPCMRGLQALALIGGLTGFDNCFPWVAALLTGWRNREGDRRDAVEDRAEGILTWPVLMGQEKDKPFNHLLALFVTTWVWWWFSKLPYSLPLCINLIQAATYWKTPRPSNKNANLSVCGKVLLRNGRWGG
jgi:hypothetical protein